MNMQSRSQERGVALVAVLVVMLLVVGVIGIFSMLAVGDTKQARTDRQRAESLYWVQTAAAEVQGLLRSSAVGPHALASGSTGATQLWRVPGATRRPLTVNMPSGERRTGFYEILAPTRSGPANSVALVRNAADLEHRGEVSMLLRGSTTASDPSPRTVRVVFRRASLAHYAIVSDAPIDVGNLGSTALRGSIHSNNVQGAAVGVRLAGANTSRARTVSTTSGRISGTCSASVCLPASGTAVSFTNIDRAFAEVERLHARGGCTARIACVIGTPVAWQPSNSSPAYRVELDAPGGCVR
ncbi:MAG: hypothetical protein ABI200_03710, partial [Gaiellales bacterium]